MIQLFPGHMAKTVRQLKDKSKSIDGLVDIRDARIPFSSKTPIFRNYDVEKKFSSEKDKLVYGLQKKTSNHTKKSKYLTI